MNELTHTYVRRDMSGHFDRMKHKTGKGEHLDVSAGRLSPEGLAAAVLR